MDKIWVQISSEPLDVSSFADYASDDGAGAEVVFVGTVRNKTRGKEVLRLEFEAYEKMAVSELNKIASIAIERWGLNKIAIGHRVGVLGIGEVPVVIAVCSAHRKVAFEACEFCIDELKKTVPIWKKEIFEDGEEWVTSTP